MGICDWLFGGSWLFGDQCAEMNAAYHRQIIENQRNAINPYVDLPVLHPVIDARKDLNGAAMTPGMKRALALAQDPNLDALELAWFACEATDQEWAEYCRAADARLGIDSGNRIWPKIACDGAVLDIGRMVGGA